MRQGYTLTDSPNPHIARGKQIVRAHPEVREYFGPHAATGVWILGVVGLHPWYDPRYFIPLGGMIMGNSMTSVALGAERLHSGLLGSSAEVEGALMLGATPADAARPFVKHAFGAAVLPTVNSMMGMGIVFLPGMMTGQILAGAEPVEAVKYQILIMGLIMGATTAGTALAVQVACRHLFDTRERLRLDRIRGL